MSLRNKLIRLAYEKPELREDILPLLRKEAAGWMNYNTIGKRKFVKAVLHLMGSRTPATLLILKRQGNEVEFDRLKKKWQGKGNPVKERGISGIRVLHRGQRLLIATVGGEEVMIKENFKV